MEYNVVYWNVVARESSSRKVQLGSFCLCQHPIFLVAAATITASLRLLHLRVRRTRPWFLLSTFVTQPCPPPSLLKRCVQGRFLAGKGNRLGGGRR